MNHDSTPLSRPICLAHVVAVLLLCLCLNQAVFAQDNAQNSDQAPRIEQEYQSQLEKWMMRAYEGDRDAQFKVGVLYTNSQFNQPDFEQAVYWYKQAARQGHMLAQYNLGHQYLTGVGVNQSQTTAMNWWLKAAKQDHALAQFNIGRAYYLGIGFEKNHVLSRQWFERAAANNEPKSTDILQQLGWIDAGGALAAANLVDATDLSQTDDSIEVAASGSGDAPEIEKGQRSTGDQKENEAIDSLTKNTDLILTAIDLTPPSEEKEAADAIDNQANTEATDQALTKKKPEASREGPTAWKLGVLAEPALKANQPSINDSSAAVVSSAAQAVPIALYTNPAVRSILIAIVDDASQIRVQRETGPWSIVRSSTSGFPVWVHGDFIMVDGNVGIVTGTSVNARSVPIVINGTVVGTLNKGEQLSVEEDRDGWFRVLAPDRFQAWVKTSSLKRQTATNSARAPATKKSKPVATSTAKTPARATVSKARLSSPRPINDNSWLFAQSPGAYTLQLASFDDAQKIAVFESRAKFINNPALHRFTANGKDIEWTYYLYGSYASTELAQVAKIKINQKLAWVRSFRQLQQNRCVAWKTQRPTPKELNSHCGGR